MRILWAPWRREYVTKADSKECFLCEALKKVDGEENLILKRGKWSFIILNRFPYNSGHLMVAPLRHEGELLRLTQEEKKEIWELMELSLKLLSKVYNPHGFNIGINIGRPAGAGLITHFHLHIVPRWEGDTNFLPVFSQTKVIPEALEESYRRLKEGLEDL